MCFKVAILLALCAVSLAGAVNARELSEQDVAAGKKLYVAKCARCHKFYDPSTYSDESWSEWMDKMRKKARLTSDQHELLLRYLDALRHKGGSPQQPIAP